MPDVDACAPERHPLIVADPAGEGGPADQAHRETGAILAGLRREGFADPLGQPLLLHHQPALRVHRQPLDTVRTLGVAVSLEAVIEGTTVQENPGAGDALPVWTHDPTRHAGGPKQANVERELRAFLGLGPDRRLVPRVPPGLDPDPVPVRASVQDIIAVRVGLGPVLRVVPSERRIAHHGPGHGHAGFRVRDPPPDPESRRYHEVGLGLLSGLDDHARSSIREPPALLDRDTCRVHAGRQVLDAVAAVLVRMRTGGMLCEGGNRHVRAHAGSAAPLLGHAAGQGGRAV